MSEFCIYGVKFKTSNAHAAARLCAKALLCGGNQVKIFTPNFKILLAARKSTRLVQLLNSAELLLPDGMGVSLLCRANGLPPIPRVTGIDFGFMLTRLAARHSLPVFLLGARAGVAKRAAQRLKRQIPHLDICGTHHGYFDKSPHSQANRELINKINAARPALLLVCFGFPTQERWIAQNIHSLPTVRIAAGLGGSLDVWSGDIKRAPMALRVLNLEWLYRTRGRGFATFN